MKIKLLCLPYAGASANMYLRWKPFLDTRIELIPVEYPGRGKCFTSKLCTTMDELTAVLYNRVSLETAGCQFAFFGHSLGSLAIMALTYKLQELDGTLPVHLFCSGNIAPHYNRNRKIIYHLPDAQFVQAILGYGGTAPEIFASEELKNLFLPIIRADIKIADTYCPGKPGKKLNIDFTILYGKEDSLLYAEGIAAWKECTNNECRMIPFEGDHMYLQDKGKELAGILNRTLRCYM